MSDEAVYVVTDPLRRYVYGMTWASSQGEAMHQLDMRQRDVLVPGLHGQPPTSTGVVLAGDLADGQWRELGPVGAQPNGDCGGDVQVSSSFSRRFVLARKTEPTTWAVVTHAWYAINETAESVGPDTPGEVIERQTEWLVVDDLRDLDYVISQEQDRDKEYDYEATEAGARRAAEEFAVDYVTWNGEPD